MMQRLFWRPLALGLIGGSLLWALSILIKPLIGGAA